MEGQSRRCSKGDQAHVATEPEPVAVGCVARRRPVDREVITARAGQLVGKRNEGHPTVGLPGKLRTRGERDRHVEDLRRRRGEAIDPQRVASAGLSLPHFKNPRSPLTARAPERLSVADRMRGL